MVLFMKNRFWSKTAAVCTAVLLVFCLLLSGCAGRPEISAETFTSVCENAGYTVVDVSEAFDPAFITTVLTVSGETHAFGYYTFANETEAMSNYAQFLSTVKTGAPGEKFIDSPEYHRFYYANSRSATVVYRNGLTMIFLSGSEVDKIEDLIDTLGI